MKPARMTRSGWRLIEAVAVSIKLVIDQRGGYTGLGCPVQTARSRAVGERSDDLAVGIGALQAIYQGLQIGT